MQNLNYNPEEINRYIQSVTPQPQYTVPNINFEDYTRPTQNTLLATPEQILARRQAEGGDLYQPTPLPTNNDVNQYSDYGINYDINGDGKVGIFEGITLGGLGKNILSGVRELGTGLTYIGTHPKEVMNMTGNYLADVGYKSGGNPLKNLGYITTDFTDAILHPYALDSEARNRNLGNVTGALLAGDLSGARNYAQAGLSEMTHRIYEHPTDVLIDAGIPIGGQVLKGLTKGGKAATKAQSAISSKVAKIAQDTEKVRTAGEGMVKNKSNIPTAALVEAAETGNWSGIPQEAKVATKNYSDIVNNTMKKYSPSTWVEPEEIAIIQKYARDNGTTYQAAERIIKPILEESNKGTIVVQRGYHYSPNTDIKKFANESIGDFTGRADHGHGLYVSTVEDTAKGYTKIFDEQAEKAGRLYEIELPEESRLLRETLPLSQQSELVQEAISKLAKNNDNLARAIVDDAIGSDLYKAISDDASKASKLLDNNGIKGIKYYEGTPSEGVSIFNPSKNANILSKERMNLKALEQLAKEDPIAEQVLQSKRLFDKGDIFPITHGLAEVDKTANVDELGRIMAGRFSTRAFGNASYENIAKQIANPNDYINQLTKNYLDESVRDILKNGYSGDIDIRPANPKDAMYISRELLEGGGNKSVKQALDSASSSPVKPDDIAIDKDFLKAFKDQYQLQQTNNPFGRTPLGDLYNLKKSTALASGGYLVGNLQTGVANAIINSNIGLIDDVINATLTKGKLAKNLGVYRRDTFKNTNITPLGKKLQDININTGGALLQKADSAIQNTMAEIAAHAELRRKGVTPRNRVRTIENMEASKLGELINDVKLVSLINPTKSLAPSWMAGVGGVFNPFWRWVDTAAQSSLYMLNRHPVLANAVLFDALAKAGYDKEMQNRLGIDVELDKPFVSYKVNPKTGEAREMSMEFLPQMNTLKFSSELVDAIKGKGDLDSIVNTSIPLIGTTLLAMRGLNKYGKPMYRDHKSMYDSISVIDGKRYKLNPETGLPEPEGGHLDEVISALANETLGGLSLFNRTLAPSIASGASKLTGQDYDYYLPYGQALFGSFAKRGEVPQERIPFLVAGDPTRPRGDQEIGNMLRGIYESPYYPSSKLEQGIYNPTILRNFYKGLNRRDTREQNILMNR